MAILVGAVAYRNDLASQHEFEIDSWELREPGSTAVPCRLKGCDVRYELILPIGTPPIGKDSYVAILRTTITKAHPEHPYVVNVPATHQ